MNYLSSDNPPKG